MKKNLPKFIELDFHPFKYGKGSLYKDIKREANLAIIKDVLASPFRAYKFLAPKVKMYKVGWKDVAIAFLLGLLLATTHTGHAQEIGVSIQPHTPLKPKTALQTPQIAPQSQIASVPEAPAPAPAPTPVTGCGSDPNMAYIYQHESGCSTGAVNYIGCAGLGQACPGSKLPCSLSDWDCQNTYFTAYAINTYGSTYSAMLAWQSKSWW